MTGRLLSTWAVTFLVRLSLVAASTLSAPAGMAASTQFLFTGAEQSFTVPAGVTALQIDACGGAGGTRGQGPAGGTAYGGYMSAIVPVTPGTTLYVLVGGSGQDVNRLAGVTSTMFNGGGYSTWGDNNGGGASDVRTSSGGALGQTNLESRLVVAGGGGGNANYPNIGGLGGGSTGGRGTGGGYGGSQLSGGANTADGASGAPASGFGYGASYNNGGGGGGGYYGGGCGSGNTGAGGGSSYCMSTGTILFNVQGDSRCNGDGLLFVSVLAPPTAAPTTTAPPTKVPTALPTLHPTAKFSDVAGARHVVTTLHRGRKCTSEPLGYIVRGYSLGNCVSLSSPTPAPTPTRTPSSYRLTCRGGWSEESTYSVRQDSYYDSSCSLSAHAASTVLVHGDACTGNHMRGMAGGSVRSSCVGAVQPDLITSREQLLTLSFSDSRCTAGGRGGKEAEQLVSLFFGVCLPFMRKGERLVADYHRRLTWIAGDGVNTDIVLQSTSYSETDNQCSRPPTASETVIYQKSNSLPGTCVADPLIQNRYYSRVGRSLNPRTDTAVSWANSIVTMGTFAPTASPTFTASPTAVPTKSPSRPPTSVLQTGLVLELDAQTYEAGEPWLDTVSGTQFTMYGDTASKPQLSTDGGSSVLFDPSKRHYGQGPSLPTLLTSFTVEVWFKPIYGTTFCDGCGPVLELVSGGKSNFFFYQDGGKQFNWGYFNGNWRKISVDGIGEQVKVPSGTWAHMLGTCAAGAATTACSFYMNGVLISTDSSLATLPVRSEAGIRLMSRYSGDPTTLSPPEENFLGGHLGVVRIYNVAMTAADVFTNFCANRKRFGFTTFYAGCSI